MASTTSTTNAELTTIFKTQVLPPPPVKKKEDNYAKDQILMHIGEGVTVNEIKYWQIVEGQGNSDLPIKQLKLDAEKQLMAIVFSKNLAENSKGILTFIFKPETRYDLRGLHFIEHNSVTYASEEKYGLYLTKFQPSDARLFFPCFDEPQFKAKFDLRIARTNQRFTALSNTLSQRNSEPSEGASLVHFKTTEVMPVHMFAFALGELDFVGWRNIGRGNILVKAYTTPGLEHRVSFAAEVATKSIVWMEEYTNSNFPLGKFDMICVLNHDKDNTENWGLATIRSRYCLFDKDTLLSARIRIAINVAHVVAHQWYGNLVTAKWWDSLWITEGAAAFLAFKMVGRLYPSFNSDYFVQFYTLSNSIVYDNDRKKSKTHCLANVVGDLAISEKANELFDSLEFTKSGSLFKLMEKKIGEENLRRALTRLIHEPQFTSVDSDDFESVIPRENQQNFELSLFSTQINQVRAPELHIKLFKEGGKFQLMCKQDVFAAGYLNASLHFYEINERYEKIRDVRQPVDLRSDVNRCPEWFDFSNKNHYLMVDPEPDVSQYYHLNIDKSLDQNFERVIRSRLTDAMGRANLLEHAIRSYKIRGPDYTEHLEKWLNFYQSEEDYRVMLRMLEAMKLLAAQNRKSYVVNSFYDKIEHKFYRNGAFFPSFNNRLVYSPGEKNMLIFRQPARAEALTWLIKANRKEVYVSALKFFDKGTCNIRQADLRVPVYTAVAKYGTEAQVEQLRKNLLETESLDERTRLVKVLASYEGPKINDDQLEKFCSKVRGLLPVDTLSEAEDMCRALLDLKRKNPHDGAETSDRKQKSQLTASSLLEYVDDLVAWL